MDFEETAPDATPTVLDKAGLFSRKLKNATKLVPLPDGDAVYIRKLSQAEVEYMAKNFRDESKGVEGMRYVFLKGVADEHGGHLFGEKDGEQVKRDVDFDVLKLVSEAVTEFSGLKDPKKAGEAAKND